MFGLFNKKKISADEDQFVWDLAQFSSDFRECCSVVNDVVHDTFSKQALSDFLGKNPSDPDLTACEIYLGVMALMTSQACEEGNMQLGTSIRAFTEVSHFLETYRRYDSNAVQNVMTYW